MALTVDYLTLTIAVPKIDLTLVSGTVYKYSIGDTMRADMKAQEASEEGITFQDMHQHNTEVLLAGILYARVVEFINGFTVTIEDGQYGVNLFGANHNMADVINRNQVSIAVNNSAGLQTVPGGGLSGAQDATLTAISRRTGMRQRIWIDAGDNNAVKMTTYEEDGLTEFETHTLLTLEGNIPDIDISAITERGNP